MSKKSLSLCLIALNEEHNLKPLHDSIEGCFDEIILVDTGSTDNTVEVAKSLGMRVEHFKWINDFSAARNYSFSFATGDYVMWMDLDDRLTGRESFLLWKEHVMPLRVAWGVKYDYAFNKEGHVMCSFLRERVVKRSMNFKWIDFIHEGLKTDPHPIDVVNSWWITHARTEAELKGDRGRNLKILEERFNDLNPRMKFYYLKELYDAGQTKRAIEVGREALKAKDLLPHDRVLGIQYLCWSLFNEKLYSESIQYGILGLQMSPKRAELFCIIGDCYGVQGRLADALPYYQAAMNCQNTGAQGMEAIFSAQELYYVYPKKQIAKIYFQMGEFQRSFDTVKEFKDPESEMLSFECQKAMQTVEPKKGQVKTTDIVITCPPVGAYKWDSEIYKTKGLGGSETMAVEMAHNLGRLTGRKVLVFNPRDEVLKCEDGVEYHPTPSCYGYFQKYEPAVHIAWRHSLKLTEAPSYIWSHDLFTMGAENVHNYAKVLALTPFHANYMRAVQALPEDKVLITRNGINPARFSRENLSPLKRIGKVIWPSSPDRGLEHAIFILDIVRKEIPWIELHCFYGMENLEKYGLGEKAKMLRELIAERPWIKYVGNVDQKRLVHEFSESEVWLYPADFIESSCIVAVEALLTRCWPVVRRVGALQDTLKVASEQGMCDLLDLGVGPEDYPKWAEYVVSAIKNAKWNKMDFKPEEFSVESVAREWVDLFDLGPLI